LDSLGTFFISGCGQAAAMGLTTTELTARIYYGSPGFRLIEPREQVAVRRVLVGLARSELVIRLGPMHHRSRDCYWHVGFWAYDQRG
jgi:hypothetical protein